ncbi:hypothetical protein [Natrialba sp. SSL1]|uniref:hypothetical protein n=1 Tax=Natrialba sp. SSL1 TaxID=1869245 RepID=UPI0008F96685|nr:hypothetical protein [Natrialba sp. SSL1]OIB56586.1 hypothetical protein BBD46_17300 [Natrialba sp. SSL1]
MSSLPLPEQADIDHDELTPVAQNIANCGAFLDRHKEQLDELGLDLRSDIGMDRLVFDTPAETVIKIARSEVCVDINYDEQCIWSLHGSCGLFAPIVGSGPDHSWIEMAECTPASEDDYEEFKGKEKEAGATIRDTHIDNVGEYSNTVVTFDYPDVDWDDQSP